MCCPVAWTPTERQRQTGNKKEREEWGGGSIRHSSSFFVWCGLLFQTERGLCNLDATVVLPPLLTPSAVTPASQTPRAKRARERENRQVEIEEVWCVAVHPPDARLCSNSHISTTPRSFWEAWRTELIPSVNTEARLMKYEDQCAL